MHQALGYRYTSGPIVVKTIKPVGQTEGAGPPRINVVQNFFEELNLLVPN